MKTSKKAIGMPSGCVLKMIINREEARAIRREMIADKAWGVRFFFKLGGKVAQN